MQTRPDSCHNRHDNTSSSCLYVNYHVETLFAFVNVFGSRDPALYYYLRVSRRAARIVKMEKFSCGSAALRISCVAGSMILDGFMRVLTQVICHPGERPVLGCSPV
jgi:hypothetical protein